MDIDANSREWQTVTEFVKARTEELRDRCCALNATAQDRQDAAARIDELRMLLTAPSEARILSDGETEAQGGREKY